MSEIESFEDFCINEEQGSFSIIDIDNPSSIASYGADVLESFEKLRENLPLNFVEDIYKSYEFEVPALELVKFNESFTEESGTKEKIRKNKLANGVCNLLNRISKGHIDLLNDNENYAEVYIDYLENIQKICEQIRKDKVSLENDVKFFMKFKLYVEMLEDKLNDLIAAGNTYIENYKVTLLQMEKSNPSKANLKKVFVDVAEERMMALRTTMEIMKGLCAQIDLKTAGSMRQKIKYDEYLQVTAPTLNIYASLAIGIKRDASRLERLRKVSDIANETIKAASLKLEDNIETILNLDNDSLITKDTLSEMVKSYQKGVDLLALSQQEKSNSRKAILKTFDEYDKIFDKYKSTITRALIGGEEKVKRLN